MTPKKKSNMGLIVAAVALVFAVFVSLHAAGAYAKAEKTAAKHKTKIDYGAMMQDLGERLEKTPFKLKWNDYSLKFAGVSAFLVLIVFGYFATSKKKLIRGKEYGTADWATRKDIAPLFAENQCKAAIAEVNKQKGLDSAQKRAKADALTKKYADADMILTATERISIFNWVLNNNTLLIGGSGSGKTRGYLMPNLLQAHSSFVITDPKGEILAKSGQFLEDRGYKIRVLNLDVKTQSDGYNPFAYIHREREGWEERVLSLIETIIVNTNGGENKGGSDPFWDKAERLFLQALFFFVLEWFPEEDRNMNSVSELISWLQIADENDAMDSELDHFAAMFAETFGADHIGVQQYREFREKAAGKTAKSIVISAVARLAPFKVREVRRMFGYDAMHLEMVGEEKTAVFVIVPPTDKTYNFIAGMLFTQLFQELNHCALVTHKEHGQRLPVPCRFLLDEFANTCTIPNFVSILAYARSLGVGITVILQSLEQIKAMYEKDWGVIIDNCNTLLYLGSVTHADTLEYMSKLLGKGTFDKESTSVSRGRSGSSSKSSDKIGRELLDSSEIRKLPKTDCLLIVGGKNPFYSKKYDYTKHKNYPLTSDGDPSRVYTYHPAPAPERRDTPQDPVAVIPPLPCVPIPPSIITEENPDRAFTMLAAMGDNAAIDDTAVSDGADETTEPLHVSAQEVQDLADTVSAEGIELFETFEMDDITVDDGEDWEASA